jgi:hypothetical protein
MDTIGLAFVTPGSVFITLIINQPCRTTALIRGIGLTFTPRVLQFLQPLLDLLCARRFLTSIAGFSTAVMISLQDVEKQQHEACLGIPCLMTPNGITMEVREL